MNRPATAIFFSPRGSTAKIARFIADRLSPSIRTIDLLRDPLEEPLSFSSEEAVVVAMPVYVGRIPTVCPPLLAKLQGNNTPAIAVTAYGNRHYDDALLELTDLLKERGFVVAGAAALPARHSIFQSIAAGRPDEADWAKLEAFATKWAAAIEGGAAGGTEIPGRDPYRPHHGLPIKISVNSKCHRCGACATVCPADAIPAEHPHTTDHENCIRCTACIAVCPQGARAFRGFKFWMGERVFKKKCALRREPEFFQSRGPFRAL